MRVISITGTLLARAARAAAVLAAAGALAGAAHAQDDIHGERGVSYQRQGNMIYASDGTTYMIYGDMIYGTDGSYAKRTGNKTYFNSPVRGPAGTGQQGGKSQQARHESSSEQVGDTLYNSDGRTVTRQGEMTYGSDGTTCRTTGNTTICQ